MSSFITILLCCLTAFFCTTSAIPTISAVGSKFFTSDGNQFYIKGVAYQLISQDPLVDTAQCQLDAALMKQLGVNTIRVYHVDATQDHSGCMNAFAQAGIYLFVDCDSFYTYIRFQGEPPSWNQTKSDAYRAVIDNFQQYDNTAGFFVGNEVLNVITDSGSAPFLLAAAADLKGYQKAKGYRKIPIGYSATDTAVLRPMLQDYLVCRSNETERVDFYSLNSYEWCGSTPTYETSGYSGLQALALDYPVPIFFSEDGCNTVPPRTFDDQSAIFGPDMVDTWSGAIIYEWIQELNEYGLVQYGPYASGVTEGTSVIDGYTRQGTPTPIAPDFTNLQAQWATLTPTGVSSAAYVATYSTSAPTCPSYTAGGWTVDPNAALPTVGQTGVTSGLPSGIPTGSITSFSPSSGPPLSPSTSVTTTTRSGSDGHTTTGSRSATKASGSVASSSATAAAGKSNPNPLSSGEVGFMGMVIALITVGAGAIFLL